MPASAPAGDLLVASVLGASLEVVDAAVSRFAAQFGTLTFVSEPLDFLWTSYYAAELGATPRRRIIAVEGTTDASALVAVKRATARLEVALARRGGGRTVNLDPGVLGAEQLVLASTKPRGHRIHLGRGVYAELTLLLGPEGFAPLPWTYPDYAAPPLRGIFAGLRERLLETRRLRRMS